MNKEQEKEKKWVRLSCYWCEKSEDNNGGYDEDGNWYCEKCWEEYKEQNE